MQNLILSKKGFDTENGGGPSPIFDDQRMVSLPIPEPRAGVCMANYGNLVHDKSSYADLLASLGYSVAAADAAHLDPDLLAGVRTREMGWRGMFGQVDQAESHLINEGVGTGSLFLFWGWFEHLGVTGPFSRSPGFSSLYGYLEVGQVIEIGISTVPSYAQHHPHAAVGYPQWRNRIYIARERLSWDDQRPGWGVFKYRSDLRLSVDGAKRSVWQLPDCFHPHHKCRMTYNTNPQLWSLNRHYARVKIPARGQEFVCTPTDGVVGWARRIIDQTETWTYSPLPDLPQRSSGLTPRLTGPSNAVRMSGTPEATSSQVFSKDRPMATKPRIAPLPGERLVSFGDRLLWHQLGLQVNGHAQLMLTEDEYVEEILKYFPDAVVSNVRQYKSYFNGKHKSMGFKSASTMPLAVEFRK